MFDIVSIPIENALVYVYVILTRYSVPGALGFAIILLTGSIRLILQPLFSQQTVASKQMSKIKPKLDELQKKHKDDKEKLNQAQMDLYKEHGINPASGCLYALIQFPVIIGLYQGLSKLITYVQLTNRQTYPQLSHILKQTATESAHIIKTFQEGLYSKTLLFTSIDPHFFIYNLALSPASVDIRHNPQYWYYALVPIITAMLQYFQAQTMSAMMGQVAQKTTDLADNTTDPTPQKKSSTDDFSSAMQMQMKYFLPAFIGYLSYTLPVGLSLYWNIFSLFSILPAWKKQISSKHS